MKKMDLEEAVRIVNTTNRPDAPPLVQIAECEICGVEFVAQVQDIALAKSQKRCMTCPNADCKREVRRRRQRGERRAKSDVASSAEFERIAQPSPSAMDVATKPAK